MPALRRLYPSSCLAVMASFCLVASAGAAADPPTQTVGASGTAQVKPTPVDRNSDASIREAVENAEEKALPLAIAEAREYAGKLAAASGVRLGALLSIANTPPSFPFYYSPQTGTFPNGHYCGDVANFKTVTKNGVRRRVREKGTHKVCRVPGTVSASVTLTYAVVT